MIKTKIHSIKIESTQKKLEIKQPYPNTCTGNKDHKIRVLLFHSNDHIGLVLNNPKNLLFRMKYNQIQIKMITKQKNQKSKNILCDNKQNKIR